MELSSSDFMLMLWQLGIDTRNKVEIQEGLTHRNKFNEIVNCTRWVGLERTDRKWLQSPHASLEASYFSADPSTKRDMQRLMGRDSSVFRKQDEEELSYTLTKISELPDDKNKNSN